MRYQKPRRKPIMTQTRLILIGILISALVMGGLAAFEDGQLVWNGLLGNLSTEMVGALLTFFVIDRLIKQNSEQEELRDQLIREMENPDIGITKRAVTELRHRGWLQDGSLGGWFFKRANLEGIKLSDAELTDVGFYRCNLTGTRISDEQLASLNDLRFCTLPDGTQYDGRFCLYGDVKWAMQKYGLDLRLISVQEAAEYYGVTPEQYVAGQRWAQAHLFTLVGRTPVLTQAAL